MKYYHPEIETLKLESLRKIQNERLQRLVQRVYRDVKPYRKKLDEGGIGSAEIKTVDDLHKMPFTTKEDLRNNYPFDFFAVPMDEIRRIHASSGTTGKPTVVGYTLQDLEVFNDVVARSLVCAGAQPGMKLHNAYGYGLFTGGLGMHGGAQKLGMAVIPVSGGMTERQLMIIRDFQPDVICCTPSYAQTLSEQFRLRNFNLEDINLKFGILGAEPWTETIRKEVEEGMNIIATNIYGLSEIMGPGVSQEDHEEKGSGSYIWEDHFYPEVVDPKTGEPLPHGQEGVLVFTTLTKMAFPLIRYWTNDICSIYYDSDAKRTHIKMSSISGRADDMLIIRGVNLFPTQIEELLDHNQELSANYQIVVTKHNSLDEISVRTESKPSFQQHHFNMEGVLSEAGCQLERLVEKKLHTHLGLRIKVSLEQSGKIARSEGGKLKRVLDLRGNKQP